VVIAVTRQRLILADRADAVRVALLGETSGWVPDSRPGEDGAATCWWRTRFGLRVSISHDSLLDRPVLELAADDDAAEAEAAELSAQLPRVVSAVRFADALEMFSQNPGAERRAAVLPLLAATLAEGDDAGRARVLDAAGAALASPDARQRAGGVLAAGYLADESLSARVRELAAADPDLRVRAVAGQVAGPSDRLAKADWVRRITFVADSVADHFLPFAAERGWSLTGHQPGTDDESEQFLWQAGPAVRVALVRDIRLERDYVIVNGTDRDVTAAADGIELLVRTRFPAVELDDVLDLLSRASGAAERLVLLRVAAAAAPVSYHPRMYAVLAGLFADPVTALRGFAIGASVYYPWPEFAPLLDWSRRYDPDPAIRGLADIGLDAVRRAHRDNEQAIPTQEP
jgi:hypothetical protein